MSSYRSYGRSRKSTAEVVINTVAKIVSCTLAALFFEYLGDVVTTGFVHVVLVVLTWANIIGAAVLAVLLVALAAALCYKAVQVKRYAR